MAALALFAGLRRGEVVACRYSSSQQAPRSHQGQHDPEYLHTRLPGRWRGGGLECHPV